MAKTVKCVECGERIRRVELPRKCSCGSSMALFKVGGVWRRVLIFWEKR